MANKAFSVERKKRAPAEKQRYIFMKNRVSKKKHKEFLPDIVYFISMSNKFRPKLIKKEITKISINVDTIDRSEDVWGFLNRWNLEYIVEVAPDKEIDEFPYYEGCILFKFYPKDYPWVVQYSGNNPDVLEA